MAEAMLKFKPELWSKTILKELSVITGMRKHSDYTFSEEIKYGKKLHITKLGDTQIRNYVQGQDITFDEVDGDEIILEIDQQRYFGKYYDDIDAKQAIPGAVEADMAETAKALALDADKFVSAKLYKGVTDGKIVTSEEAIAADAEGKEYLEAMEEGLVTMYSKNVTPQTEIWGEVSPHFYSKVRVYLTELSTNNIELMKKGVIGKYHQINVAIENLLPVKSGVKYNFLRTGKAFAFAEQIDKVAKVEKENGFGQKFKGLYVYGGVIVRPEEAYAIKETVTDSDSDFLDRVTA